MVPANIRASAAVVVLSNVRMFSQRWRKNKNIALLSFVVVVMFDLLASSSSILYVLALPADTTNQNALSSASSPPARLKSSASLHSSHNNNSPRRIQLRRSGLAQLQASPNISLAEFSKQFLPDFTSSQATTPPATSSATTSSSVIILGLHQPADNISIINTRNGTNKTQMAVVRRKQRNHISLNIVDTSRRSKLQPKRISSSTQSAASAAKAALTAMAVAVPPLQPKSLVMSPLAKIINVVGSSNFTPSTTVQPPSVLTTTATTKKVAFREALSAAKQKQLLKNDTREREIEAATTTISPDPNIIKLRPSGRHGGTLLTKLHGVSSTDGANNNETTAQQQLLNGGNSTKRSASMIETEHLLLLGALGAFGGGGMGGGGGIGGSYARTGGYPVASAPSPVGHFMGGGGFPMLGALALAEGFEFGGDLMKGLMGMTMMSRMMGPAAQQQTGAGNGGTFGTEPYSPGGYVHTGVGLPA